jgi:uncharacterized membrane protein YfcA
LLLARVRALYGSGVNDFLRVVIAILLIVIPLDYPLKNRVPDRQPSFVVIRETKFSLGITLIGLLAGVLVGVPSIGSSSIILMLLLVFHGFPP